MYRKSLRGAACFILAVTLAGCQRNARGKAEPEVQAVPVSQPVQRYVTEYVDYTGRTEAVLSVDVRARATGHLIRRHFKDGSFVKKDALLFEIDPRLYQAQLDQARAQIRLNEASLKLARKTYERDRASPGAVSKQQLDEDLAAVDQAVARVNTARETARTCEINLEFTKIYSPIDGQISRTNLTEGNLVNQDQTLLTNIVSVDPMYVYFDMDEPTRIRINNMANKGELKALPDGSINMDVLMQLQGEKDYPHKGTINFFNNQFTATTGSITVRGDFPNPKPSEHGVRQLAPGMFVRVRLPLGEARSSLLVLDRAIGSDQGQKYVYVVDADNKVQYRRIETGSLQPDGLRVITSGVKPNDWVVVGGLPQIRSRMEVKPDRTQMPTLASGQSSRDKLPRDEPAKKPAKGNKTEE
jgi:multidrug efflux system membrane fusion protein